MEPINNCTINKISKEIKDNKKMFKPMKRLAPINYLLLLKDKKDNFWSDEINMTFDRWNKRYGNNIKVGGEDDTKKNNIQQIAQQVKEDLNRIEPDDDKVLNSLVAFLYKKPSTRKKNLLWYVYGEKIYQNLSENVDHKTICRQCGARVDETLIRGKCFKCRQEEIKKKGGKKLIVCVDCGKEVKIDAKNKRQVRCEKCQKARNNEKNLQRVKKCQKKINGFC